VFAQMQAAQRIVQYQVIPYVDRNARMQAELASMCLVRTSSNFRVWERPAYGLGTASCKPQTLAATPG